MAKAPPQHRRASTGKPHIRTARYRPRENRSHSGERGYGHRWTKFRKAFLSANPLCEYCLPKGTIKPAEVCDHDLPHGGDMQLFWDNTYTALCKHCHDSTKQRMEARHSGEALLRAIMIAKLG